MTSLAAFVTTAATVADPRQRRWVAGAAYRVAEAVRYGETHAAAVARYSAQPQYAKGLNDAGLMAAFQAIDAP